MPCACCSDDPYECWADRYNLGICDIELVELDGGPCECVCHDNDDWNLDDDDFFG